MTTNDSKSRGEIRGRHSVKRPLKPCPEWLRQNGLLPRGRYNAADVDADSDPESQKAASKSVFACPSWTFEQVRSWVRWRDPEKMHDPVNAKEHWYGDLNASLEILVALTRDQLHAVSPDGAVISFTYWLGFKDQMISSCSFPSFEALRLWPTRSTSSAPTGRPCIDPLYKEVFQKRHASKCAVSKLSVEAGLIMQLVKTLKPNVTEPASKTIVGKLTRWRRETQL